MAAVTTDPLRGGTIMPLPLDEPLLYFTRPLPDGRLISVCGMTYGKARLNVGGDNPASDGYDDGWCYENPRMAVTAAILWDGTGDPMDGWHRHIGSGRRRPDGDPTREHSDW